PHISREHLPPYHHHFKSPTAFPVIKCNTVRLYISPRRLPLADYPLEGPGGVVHQEAPGHRHPGSHAHGNRSGSDCSPPRAVSSLGRELCDREPCETFGLTRSGGGLATRVGGGRRPPDIRGAGRTGFVG